MEKTFIFDSYTVDLPSQRITFVYKIEGEGVTQTFTEKIYLPQPVQTPIPESLLRQLMGGLHLILGISYWKLYCPKNISIKSFSLTEEQARFWNTTYTKGLGEFFYKNKIDFRGLVQFPHSESQIAATSFPRKHRSLVGIGGGKDSLVSLELLKKQKHDILGYVMNMGTSYPLIDEVIKIAGIESMQIRRVFDPQLHELHKSRDTFNGHIPISAIYGFMGVLLAVLYDFEYVIASNEKSASYGNVEYYGETINHQWSKSVEYESMFQQYVHTNLSSDITYFSYLRPFYEIGIVEEFVKYPQYFYQFSSCNRNFSTRSPIVKKRWCGECPKCAFVFALMTAFLPKDTVLDIFGKNLFADAGLITIYKELLGITGNKPFDCVGTPDETIVAFSLAHEKGEYDHDSVMKMFIESIHKNTADLKKLKNEVLKQDESILIPREFKNL